MLTLILFSVSLIQSVDCDFESAFEKGANDSQIGSFGANLDRYCRYATAEQKVEFPRFYELGRQSGPILKRAGITRTPKSETELEGLLKEARAEISTQEAIKKIAESQNTSTNNVDFKSLQKRIDALEQENKRLTEQLTKNEPNSVHEETK